MATFVGREACAACHDDQTALWSGSHHDLAMQVADGTSVLGTFDAATFTYAGTTSTFDVRDGTYVVRTDGADGELHDFEIAYTFGVDPLQQYLVEFPDGRLQALSIAWDSRPEAEGGQRWFHLYPDEAVDHEDVLHWTGLAQNWNFMCAECHSTNVEKNYTLDTDSYATSWSDIDVSCESCHGPGSEHVVWAEAVTRGEIPADDEIRGLVVDLADRDAATWDVDSTTGLATRSVPRTARTKVEMCARCHSRRALATDRYVYGRPLIASHSPALLTEGLYYADGQIQDEVYVYGSFLQSKMYAAGVTCSDCHDSHALDVRGDGNARCAACHQPATFDTPEHHFHESGTAGASCVECHMPATTYMAVDPRRDHSFRSPRPDLSVTLGTPNACTSCHTDQPAQGAADAVTERYGPDRPAHYAEALHAGRRGLPGALDQLAALAVNVEQPGIVRATAIAELSGSPGPAAIDPISQGLVQNDPLIRLSAVGAVAIMPPEAQLSLLVPLLDDALPLVRTAAARVLAGVPDNLFNEPQRNALRRSLDEYRRLQIVNGDRAEAHVNLGVLAVQRGEFDEAEAAYERALVRNPSFVPAYANLADLYRTQERDDDVEGTLAQGLDAVPDSGDLHHALGLLEIRQQRRTEGVASLGRAAELMPDVARYSYVYGIALNSIGQTARAVQVLERIHERQPGDRDILLALTTISRDNGAIETAITYGRRLQQLEPDSSQIVQLLAQLESQPR